MSNVGEPVTVSDVFDLYKIVMAAAKNYKVGRAVDGHTYIGTARYLCDVEGHAIPAGCDVRGVYVRVTLQYGGDAYWPIRDLMDEIDDGRFVVVGE